MEVEKLIPECNVEYLDFTDRFGSIYILVPSYSKICYSSNEEGSYIFPEDVTKEQIVEMYKKSLKDNKDYVLDYVKKYGKELKINKGSVL